MTQANNPLHGIKLEAIITDLVERYGWEELGQRINIRCFTHDPSVKSSLQFLRKTPWARDKVEYLYLKANKLLLPPPKADSPASPKNIAHTKTQQTARQGKHTNIPAAQANNGEINSHIWGKT